MRVSVRSSDVRHRQTEESALTCLVVPFAASFVEKGSITGHFRVAAKAIGDVGGKGLETGRNRP
jgi:hypothetical protein